MIKKIKNNGQQKKKVIWCINVILIIKIIYNISYIYEKEKKNKYNIILITLYYNKKYYI